jgi:hypothetical protein
MTWQLFSHSWHFTHFESIDPGKESGRAKVSRTLRVDGAAVNRPAFSGSHRIKLKKYRQQAARLRQIDAVTGRVKGRNFGRRKLNEAESTAAAGTAPAHAANRQAGREPVSQMVLT